MMGLLMVCLGKGDGSAGNGTRDCKMVKVLGKMIPPRRHQVDETISGFHKNSKNSRHSTHRRGTARGTRGFNRTSY